MDSKELTGQEKVSAEWDAVAETWDSMAAEYAPIFYNLLWQETGINPTASGSMTVLDFGCGTGLLTEKLRETMTVDKVICVDAAPKMVAQLQGKIERNSWENVTALSVEFANMKEEDTVQMEAMYGTVDLVVASSVMSFIPKDTLGATMQVISKLLKSGGSFVHSDWPKSEPDNPDGMSNESSGAMYAMGGLTTTSQKVVSIEMYGESGKIFLGVARKQ